MSRPRSTSAEQDAARTRPRVSLTLSAEARALAEQLRAARSLASVSALVEVLVREDCARRRVR